MPRVALAETIAERDMESFPFKSPIISHCFRSAAPLRSFVRSSFESSASLSTSPRLQHSFAAARQKDPCRSDVPREARAGFATKAITLLVCALSSIALKRMIG